MYTYEELYHEMDGELLDRCDSLGVLGISGRVNFRQWLDNSDYAQCEVCGRFGDNGNDWSLDGVTERELLDTEHEHICGHCWQVERARIIEEAVQVAKSKLFGENDLLTVEYSDFYGDLESLQPDEDIEEWFTKEFNITWYSQDHWRNHPMVAMYLDGTPMWIYVTVRIDQPADSDEVSIWANFIQSPYDDNGRANGYWETFFDGETWSDLDYVEC